MLIFMLSYRSPEHAFILAEEVTEKGSKEARDCSLLSVFSVCVS